MELVNRTALDKARRKYPQLRTWLDTWVDVVLEADWKSIQDVRVSYPHADGVKVNSGNIVTVFNAGGNDFRLLTSIAYSADRVYVFDVLTHAEYDKEKWKAKL
jgi:mRNA interferase HigB